MNLVELTEYLVKNIVKDPTNVEVTKNEIKIYDEGLDERGKPKGMAHLFKNELEDVVKIKQTKRNFADEFGKICESKTVFIEQEPFA